MADIPHLADLVRLGSADLMAQYGHRITAHQRRALRAITECRTGALGVTVMRCAGCAAQRYRLRSCGHRSCPRCQQHTARQWLERQQAKQLPVDYFMATFTLPSALRPLAYRHARVVYAALFGAVAATCRSFGLHHPQLQGRLGFCAVLHTHSRRLDYHPHVHVVIPAGSIQPSGDGRRLWCPLQGRYLFNGRALAQVFRARLLAALHRAGLILPDSLPKQWVVNCKRVGRGLSALKYLSRYLYRGVLSERDLLGYDASRRTVTFRYRHGRTGRYERRTLPLAEFLWRIVLHVLPKGLQRVRNYGFLHGNGKRLLAVVQLALGRIMPSFEPSPAKAFLCSLCGAAMYSKCFVPAGLPSG